MIGFNWLHSTSYRFHLILWFAPPHLCVSLMKSIVLLLELCFSLLKPDDCEGRKKQKHTHLKHLEPSSCKQQVANSITDDEETAMKLFNSFQKLCQAQRPAGSSRPAMWGPEGSNGNLLWNCKKQLLLNHCANFVHLKILSGKIDVQFALTSFLHQLWCQDNW